MFCSSMKIEHGWQKLQNMVAGVNKENDVQRPFMIFCRAVCVSNEFLIHQKVVNGLDVKRVMWQQIGPTVQMFALYAKYDRRRKTNIL